MQMAIVIRVGWHGRQIYVNANALVQFGVIKSPAFRDKLTRM